MKKTILFVIAALILVSGVMATTGASNNDYKNYFNDNQINTLCADNNNGFKTECQNFYNNDKYFTIAKWEPGCRGYTLAEQNKLYKYYTTKVTGTSKKADWTSSPDVYSVLVKAGNNRVEFDGGASGTVTSKKDISHITFCGYKDDDNGGCTGSNCNGVPEFSTLTIGIAVIAVLFGLVFLRKR